MQLATTYRICRLSLGNRRVGTCRAFKQTAALGFVSGCKLAGQHGLVAVHVGAGYHAAKCEKHYAEAMRAACRAAMHSLQSGNSRLQAVATAIRALEDSPVCNAGLGSNLTEGGWVECDASLMDGSGTFGAVGAVSGVRNPIAVAHQLAVETREPMALGRVRPTLLVADGARQWALSRGLDAAPSQDEARQWHVTPAARQRWRRYHQMLAEAEAAPSSDTARSANAAGAAPVRHGKTAGKRWRAAGAVPAVDSPKRKGYCDSGEQAATDSVAYDTVGCVLVDAAGAVAAGVSSGGISMKVSGRIGEAAVYGAGCWAASGHDGRPGVACSTTGVGERVVEAGLARQCAERAAGAETGPRASAGAHVSGGELASWERDDGGPLDDACASVMEATILKGPGPTEGGVLAVRVSAAGTRVNVELSAVHGSDSMGIAFFGPATHAAPATHMLRQQRQAVPGGQEAGWPAGEAGCCSSGGSSGQLCRFGARVSWHLA